MTIGIVIPCKNYAHFLPDALDSLRKQETNPHTVIVNDGGADGAEIDRLCVEFAQRTPYVAEVVHLPRSRGIGIARNVGAAYLHTDFLLFLDSDDWLYPGALRALAETLHEGGVFAYGNYTQNGVPVETPKWSPELVRQQNITSYCALWAATAFWLIEGYSTVPVAEDWDLQLRAARMGYFGYKADALIFEHRIHEQNKWAADAREYGGMAGVAHFLENYGE
jgi:glycosyltransferase involved in cell wall biosynthesis